MDIYRVSTLNDKKDAFGRISDGSSLIYLHELSEPFERIVFQFVPEELVWDRSGSWISIPIVGRNNPYRHLTGGEDTLRYTLDFNSMYESDKDMCIKKLSFLQSLTMTDGFSGPGRNVKLAWGLSDIFRFKVWIVKSVSARMSLFDRNHSMNPQQLYIDVEMALDPEKNPRLADVRIPDLSAIGSELPIRNINSSRNNNLIG